MKTGGIGIIIAGITLFFWHLFRGEWDPAYRFGYASHQVMSVDSFILLIVGVVFYFWVSGLISAVMPSASQTVIDLGLPSWRSLHDSENCHRHAIASLVNAFAQPRRHYHRLPGSSDKGFQSSRTSKVISGIEWL